MSGLAIAGLQAGIGSFRLGPVDLSVAAGTATVVLGPSGAGKTTLLRAIAGFLPLGAGSIRLDGRRIDGESPDRRGIGFVPPTLGLLAHRRVRRNVAYALELRGDPNAAARAREWMGRFDLLPFADRFPAELSSGQRQRVALARALAADPRFLLWDEPLSALDVESRDVLIRLLREFVETRRVPLILVTHDPTTALALAGRFAVLRQGRLRLEGAPEDLPSGPLDRFTARFLGYENLFQRRELSEAAREDPLGAALLAAAGPGGLVVPDEAIRWAPVAEGASPTRVASLAWSIHGWSATLQRGPLAFHVSAPRGARRVAIGEPVTLDIDTAGLKPLELGEGEPA